MRRPKRLSSALFFAILAAGTLWAAGPGLGAEFFTTLDDLPAMPGLAEMKGKSVVFDKPEGRIVEIYAQGPVKRADVVIFYRSTLPALGWADAGLLAFRREGEVLLIEFSKNDQTLEVRFLLSPR